LATLVAMPKATKPTAPWYAIRRPAALAAAARAAADGEQAPAASAEILIYGDIGDNWWYESITAADFVRELNALDVDAITVRINSYGGSVPDGIAIHNAMRRHKAHISVEIDGTAYSIASLIAMAGDTIRMASNAMLMIHAPWTIAIGNAVELRESADHLDAWSKAMTSSYARVTGDAELAAAWLADGKDHYFTADEAQSAGLVHEIADALPIAAHAIGRDAMAARIRLQAATPAAAAAQPPKETMDPNKTTQAAAPDQAAIESKARADALAADKTRRDGIRDLFARFAGQPGVAELQQACQDDHATTVEAAGQKLLAKLAEGVTPTAGQHVNTIEDESDKLRKAATQALLARAGIDKPDSANPLRGYTLGEMARASAERAGLRTGGMDKMEMVAAAFTHSSSDFPLLLANVANKALLKGYQEADETFPLWTRAGTLSDFKPGKRVDLNIFPSLDKVPEGAEYKYGSIGDRGETVLLATYGKLFSITRQAIINDDLDAFTRVPRLMGRAAIRTIGDLVYAVLTGNPVMSDGVALFHANHGNLVNTGTAITTASVDAMRVGMATQKLGGVPLNIRTKYLLVPVALQGIANVVRASEFDVGAANARNNTIPNSVRDTFEVISDARLDAASSTAWYAAADPNVHDTIEVNYLDGNQAPYLEQKAGWNVDGTEFKVRIDAGVAPLDFRTLAKNPGA
jgi:ATP-dependent protease ClpP protease subunit